MTDSALPSAVGSPSARWLFSKHFLSARLPRWAEFADLEASQLLSDLRELWEVEKATLLGGANEGETEERFIRPVLKLLGHSFALFADIPGTGKRPDYLLYSGDEVRKAAEQAGPEAKVERALAVGDAKRFDLPLDRRAKEGDPVAQIRDYVLLSRRPFGVLTNARTWRLYARDSGLLERACHQVDLVALLEDGTAEDLRYFAAFFGAAAFHESSDGRTFLDRALEDSELHAVEVSDALERAVFMAIPALASGLLRDESRTRTSLDEAFANSLVILYRALFCLFAEARALLPVENPDYRRYSIAAHRLEVASLLDASQRLSTSSDSLFGDLQALFHLIDRGDAALGVTEYDGGLFDPAQHPWLEGRSVPDALLAPALDGLYRAGGDLVDFRDLSVRTLGTVYERLLAWQIEEREGELVLEESLRRHEFGSYFTPEPVVDAIVELSLDPVLSRKSAEAAERGLGGEEALEHLLSLRVLDPAMGSGHFLVGAAEFIAQALATDPSYDGELSLDKLRRLVAERCLYGVDLNPLAVELARLSLWLVTAEPDEPLTFLANLRVGDSLVGADTETLLDPTTGLLEAHLAASAGELLRQVGELEHRATRTGADAREKRRLFDQIEGLRLPLEVFAERSLERFQPPPERPRLHWPLEFPEAFVDELGEAREDGGFDAIVGNPPYIRVQEIGRDVANYYRARFETVQGSFDAYLVFLERALGLLSPQGRLGFIVPNKLFKLDFAKRMRALLSERELVADVLDFGASQVFSEVTNYTCILVLDLSGTPELQYRRIRGRRDEVLAELAAPEAVPAQPFVTRTLGQEPWLLVPPEEAAVIRMASEGSERLDAVTRQIFQGLITSADDVYVLENRGERAGLRVVYSRASEREVELEPDLLHTLASGKDVERYAFRPLVNLLLFPYVGDGDHGRLLGLDELERFPQTLEYLREHEVRLRAREHDKMDHAGWHGYVYPKNLLAHDDPKLGVPRLCDRLRVAFDQSGSIYLDNVDVNGVLLDPDGASPLVLLVLLNARLLDWIFRRGSVPFQNEFWSANKQFIAGLPIRVPLANEAGEFVALGERLHDLTKTISEERGGFLDWLASTVGASRGALGRRREFATHEAFSSADLVAALVRLRPSVDPRERTTRELIEREHGESVARLSPTLHTLNRAQAEADKLTYDLYGISARMRALVDLEYEED